MPSRNSAASHGSDGEHALEVSGLCCRRGDTDLFSGVEFRLRPGELLFVKGENGCGKTTLLRALCGLTQPAAGQVFWRGEPLVPGEMGGEILYIGHRDAVKDELTPLENLQVHAGLRGEHPDPEACEQALVQVGLAGREDVPVRYLSQGQRRRSALARLLLSPAVLWILDEPFNALDRGAVKWMTELLETHLVQGGLVVATSHQRVEGIGSQHVLELG